MTLAQVQAAVAVVVALIFTWAGLVMAVAVLLPGHTRRAEQALVEAPRRAFGVGVVIALLALGAAMLVAQPNPAGKLAGLALLLLFAAMLTVGSAGIASVMGSRIAEMSGARTSFGMLVRGSLVFSLAVFFPVIGWYLFAPLSALCALGAGAVALWPQRRVHPAPAAPQAA